MQLQSKADSDFIVATVENGDGGDFEHFVYGPDKSWRQITKFEDQIKTGVLGFGPIFYAISLDDAPRGKVMKFVLNATQSKPEVVVPRSERVVKQIVVTTDQIIVQTLEGGPSRLYTYGLDGSNQKSVPIPPILMRAVVSQVGIYDSLRSELWPNGLFNTTEFGTVKDPAQFKALFAYSPYHHVVDGTRCPAILLTAGLNDGRVAPITPSSLRRGCKQRLRRSVLPSPKSLSA